jgi:hypothetical protein
LIWLDWVLIGNGSIWNVNGSWKVTCVEFAAIRRRQGALARQVRRKMGKKKAIVSGLGTWAIAGLV